MNSFVRLRPALLAASTLLALVSQIGCGGSGGGSETPAPDPWSYTKTLTVTNPNSTTLTGFQVAFTLDTSDTSRFKSDLGDLRVRSTSGADLPYWIESGAGTSRTLIWTRVPSLPPGSSTLVVRHGNSTAVSQSSPTGVFPSFYEDFSADSISTARWPTTGNSCWINPSVSSGQLLFGGSSGNPGSFWQCYSYAEGAALTGAITGVVLEARMARASVSGGTGTTLRLGLAEHPTTSTWNIAFVGSGDDLGNHSNAAGINVNPGDGQNGDSSVKRVSSSYDSAYHVFSVRFDGSHASGYLDDTQVGDTVAFVPSNALHPFLWVNARETGATVNFRVDWVRARTFAAIEPTVSVGSE